MLLRLLFALVLLVVFGIVQSLGISVEDSPNVLENKKERSEPSPADRERLRHERVAAQHAERWKQQQSVPLSYLTPPHMSTGMPDITQEDIAFFLEQAHTLTEQQRASVRTIWDAKALPRFAESRSSIQQYLQAAADTAAHFQSQTNLKSKQREDGGGEGGQGGGEGGDGGAGEKKPPWKYTDIKNPPEWLKYDQTQGGLPSTRPPAVPRMIPPPPPRAYPQFSYARPTGGPYSPPPVPTYSISSPPPVAASTWLPLAAYIQPPTDQPNPTA